jgi:addiction module HigA family antidote
MANDVLCRPAWRPATPGEILRKLYLDPHHIPIVDLAGAVGVTRKHMSRVINGHVPINAEMATRIATALGTTAQYWLNLQNAVDLYDAGEQLREADKQPQRVPAFAEAAD